MDSYILALLQVAMDHRAVYIHVRPRQLRLITVQWRTCQLICFPNRSSCTGSLVLHQIILINKQTVFYGTRVYPVHTSKLGYLVVLLSF